MKLQKPERVHSLRGEGKTVSQEGVQKVHKFYIIINVVVDALKLDLCTNVQLYVHL